MDALEVPQLTSKSVEEVLKKVHEVMALNHLLKDALDRATQSLLNVSATTQEQIGLVVEFTKEEEQDVTLNGGVVVPNALKLVRSLQAQTQQALESLPRDYADFKAESLEEFSKKVSSFLQEKQAQVAQHTQEGLGRFDALMQQLHTQKEEQEKEYESIKQEVQEKLELINTEAFLNEFAELKVGVDSTLQTIDKTLSSHRLAILSQNAAQALILQKMLTLMQELKKHRR